MTRWATFDCYGTLIDWNRGIRGALTRLWPEDDPDRLLARYHEIEPLVQQESPTISYREATPAAVAGVLVQHAVLRRSLDTISRRRGLVLTTDHIHQNSRGAALIAEVIGAALLTQSA